MKPENLYLLRLLDLRRDFIDAARIYPPLFHWLFVSFYPLDEELWERYGELDKEPTPATPSVGARPMLNSQLPDSNDLGNYRGEEVSERYGELDEMPTVETVDIAARPMLAPDSNDPENYLPKKEQGDQAKGRKRRSPILDVGPLHDFDPPQTIPVDEQIILPPPQGGLWGCPDIRSYPFLNGKRCSYFRGREKRGTNDDPLSGLVPFWILAGRGDALLRELAASSTPCVRVSFPPGERDEDAWVLLVYEALGIQPQFYANGDANTRGFDVMVYRRGCDDDLFHLSLEAIDLWLGQGEIQVGPLVRLPAQADGDLSAPATDSSVSEKADRDRPIPHDEANIRVREFLRRNPEATIRQVVDAVGISIGMVHKTNAWKGFMERRNRQKRSLKKAPRQLTRQMEEVIGRDEDPSVPAALKEVVWRWLLEKADPAEKARLHAMPPDRQKELIELSLEQYQEQQGEKHYEP